MSKASIGQILKKDQAMKLRRISNLGAKIAQLEADRDRWREEVRRLLHLCDDWSKHSDHLEAENKRLRDVERAARAYGVYLHKSVNVGPLTNNPTNEAALLTSLYQSLDAAALQDIDK